MGILEQSNPVIDKQTPDSLWLLCRFLALIVANLKKPAVDRRNEHKINQSLVDLLLQELIKISVLEH